MGQHPLGTLIFFMNMQFFLFKYFTLFKTLGFLFARRQTKFICPIQPNMLDIITQRYFTVVTLYIVSLFNTLSGRLANTLLQKKIICLLLLALIFFFQFVDHVSFLCMSLLYVSFENDVIRIKKYCC